MSTPDRLPKGIGALALNKVGKVSSESHGHDRLSTEEVGGRVGVSRTTARRYLEHLVAEGRLDADVAYGSVGRPERKYSTAG